MPLYPVRTLVETSSRFSRIIRVLCCLWIYDHETRLFRFSYFFSSLSYEALPSLFQIIMPLSNYGSRCTPSSMVVNLWGDSSTDIKIPIHTVLRSLFHDTTTFSVWSPLPSGTYLLSKQIVRLLDHLYISYLTSNLFSPYCKSFKTGSISFSVHMAPATTPVFNDEIS